jgi:hypothetical protein
MLASQLPEHHSNDEQHTAGADDVDALIIDAIRHMNDDHAHNLLDYAQALVGCAWAEHAQMVSLDCDGFNLRITGKGTSETVRIGFDSPWTDAQQLRKAMVQLAHRARALRGS